MSEFSTEQRLRHFQLALSMVGITANLMTCELIQAISQMVDEKGMDFSVRDASQLAESIQKKYQAMMSPPPTDIEKLRREGKIIMGSREGNSLIEDATVSEEK